MLLDDAPLPLPSYGPVFYLQSKQNQTAFDWQLDDR